MNAPAVLKAVYATWRPVPTRKVLQLVFEVPIEQTEIAMKTLGIPDVGESLWCAIARLQETQTEPGPSAAAPSNAVPIKSGKRFSELPRSQQAALKCQDEAFQEWLLIPLLGLDHKYPFEHAGNDAENADRAIKYRLGIKSKKELDTDPGKSAAWDAMLTDYDVRGYR